MKRDLMGSFLERPEGNNPTMSMRWDARQATPAQVAMQARIRGCRFFFRNRFRVVAEAVLSRPPRHLTSGPGAVPIRSRSDPPPLVGDDSGRPHDRGRAHRHREGSMEARDRSTEAQPDGLAGAAPRDVVPPPAGRRPAFLPAALVAGLVAGVASVLIAEAAHEG